MIESYLRSSMRIPVAQRGNINDGNQTFKCLIEDVSGSGILIVTTAQFEKGQLLDLEYETAPGCVVVCKVEVRHCDDTSMGVKIVEISSQSSGGFQHYADDPRPQAVKAVG